MTGPPRLLPRTVPPLNHKAPKYTNMGCDQGFYIMTRPYTLYIGYLTIRVGSTAWIELVWVWTFLFCQGFATERVGFGSSERHYPRRACGFRHDLWAPFDCLVAWAEPLGLHAEFGSPV